MARKKRIKTIIENLWQFTSCHCFGLWPGKKEEKNIALRHIHFCLLPETNANFSTAPQQFTGALRSRYNGRTHETPAHPIKLPCLAEELAIVNTRKTASLQACTFQTKHTDFSEQRNK